MIDLRLKFHSVGKKKHLFGFKLDIKKIKKTKE